MTSGSRPRKIVFFLLLAILGWAVAMAAPECPKCGAPLEPGAAFCTQCGARVTETASATESSRPEPKDSIVQVVAVHDREMTSVLEAIVYGSTVRVDSMIGSGFAIAPGEFVSDAVLLLGAQEIKVRDRKGRTAPARIVGVDPQLGIGLLAADLAGTPPLARRESGLPRAGETLIALGFSAMQETTPSVASSMGTVSGLHREGLGIHPIEDYVQSDASLPRGFAGGAGVDLEGRLLGMSTASLGQGGIGLFIPVEWMDKAVSWIRAGQPTRAWIGAHVTPADADARKMFSLPEEVRWVAEDIFPGSPAESGGLRRGDGLLQVQGEAFSHLSQVQGKLLTATAGERRSLKIQREGKSLDIEIVLGARPTRPRLTGPDALRFYGGLEIGEGPSKGLVVTRVHAGSEASAAKLQPGDVLSALFTKKDLIHVERSDAKWRGVKDLSDLELQIQRAYGDIDFALGLKFRCKDGEKREVLLYAPLTAANAL